VKRSNDLIVGAVIVFAAVAITTAILWTRQADIGSRHERVTARFRDVGNVQVGNAVVIRGVRAGRVEALELADDGWVRVRLLLDPAVSLPPNPVVLANESSVFGEWQATVLDRSGLPADRLVRQQVEEADAVPGDDLPGATLPDLAQLTAVAGRIAGDVASVAERVEVAFDDRAARELRASIRNFSDLSTRLATTVQVQSRNLDTLSRDAREGFDALADAARALQRTAGRIDSATTNEELRDIVVNARQAALQLNAATARLEAMAGSLEKTQKHVESIASRTDTLLARINQGDGTIGLLVNDPSLYRNSDSLARELRALVADLKAHPRKYINLEVF
jgi:phospholipid/cholesterol/gamma-HCH transport system substrate-binding protein